MYGDFKVKMPEKSGFTVSEIVCVCAGEERYPTKQALAMYSWKRDLGIMQVCR